MIYGLRPFTLSGGADGGRPPRPPFLLDSLADTRCSARCFLTGDGVSPVPVPKRADPSAHNTPTQCYHIKILQTYIFI